MNEKKQKTEKLIKLHWLLAIWRQWTPHLSQHGVFMQGTCEQTGMVTLSFIYDHLVNMSLFLKNIRWCLAANCCDPTLHLKPVDAHKKSSNRKSNSSSSVTSWKSLELCPRADSTLQVQLVIIYTSALTIMWWGQMGQIYSKCPVVSKHLSNASG